MEHTHQQLASELDPNQITLASYPPAIDDDLDLSIDQDGEVWEEWIEDEDFMPGSIMTQPSLVTIPSWEEYAVRRQINPLGVKPASSRAVPESANTSAQWNKFAPEHVGIVTNTHSELNSSTNSRQLDHLLADLDV
jgi:hypothetical protein